MPHDDGEHERDNIDWKSHGLSPERRATRFMNDMKRLREKGDRLSLDFLERWVVHLIYAVMATRLTSIDDHKETTCITCGTAVYCCYPKELKQQIIDLKLERIALEQTVASETRRNNELQARIRDLASKVKELESHHRRQS